MLVCESSLLIMLAKWRFPVTSMTDRREQKHQMQLVTRSRLVVSLATPRWACGTLTMCQQLWANTQWTSHRGRPTVDVPPWTYHRGRTTMDWPPWRYHCGGPTVDVPPWTSHRGRCSTVDVPPWRSHRGRPTLDVSPWRQDGRYGKYFIQ